MTRPASTTDLVAAGLYDPTRRRAARSRCSTYLTDEIGASIPELVQATRRAGS